MIDINGRIKNLTMPFSVIIISCCLFRIVNTQNVDFEAFTIDRDKLVSPAAVLEGTKVWFNCKFENIYNAEPLLTISTRGKDNDDWDPQVFCSYGKDVDSHGTASTPFSSMWFNAANTTCTPGGVIVQLSVINLPSYYQCQWNATQFGLLLKEFILRSYIDPTQPDIVQIPWNKPKEGSKVEYRCESNGQPPPVLRFSYDGGVIPESELTYAPPLDDITDDSNRSTSIVTWSSNATKAMNGKNLKCEIYNHISNSALFQEHQMSVKIKAKGAAGGLKPGIIAVIVVAALPAMISP